MEFSALELLESRQLLFHSEQVDSDFLDEGLNAEPTSMLDLVTSLVGNYVSTPYVFGPWIVAGVSAAALRLWVHTTVMNGSDHLFDSHMDKAVMIAEGVFSFVQAGAIVSGVEGGCNAYSSLTEENASWLSVAASTVVALDASYTVTNSVGHMIFWLGYDHGIHWGESVLNTRLAGMMFSGIGKVYLKIL